MTIAGDLRPTVLHYCQHSVGLGHLVRSLSIAGALAAGFRVVLVSGGPVPEGIRVPPGVELVALPAIGSSDGGGSDLVSLEAGLSLDEVWGRRRAILSQKVETLRPVALIVELFPLGRRKFAPEILPLIEAARRKSPPVVVICSVRDILVANGPSQQARDDEAAARLNEHFDAVIVHADPALARLEETFRPSMDVDPPVSYSGYVVPGDKCPPAARGAPGAPGAPGARHMTQEVLVSAGGGKTGGPLMHAAVAAHRLHLARLGLKTRIITGPFLPPADDDVLRKEVAGCVGLTVERFVPDLCGAMMQASVSVSQCGYNSALDVVRAGIPALVIPYDEGQETEQADRARRLAALGAVRVLASRALSADRLASEIELLLSAEPVRLKLDLGGANATAQIVSGLVARSAA